MILNRLTIQNRLAWAFGLMLIIFIFFGVISIAQMNQLAELTERLYNHPFHVSNAAVEASMGIVKIHRSMKDVALSDSEMERNDAVQRVRTEEIYVYEHLDIIKKLILGEEGKELERNTRIMFEKWKPIRNRVIELAIKGEQKQAAAITKREGADYVAMLEDKMLELREYARNKAVGFMDEAHKTQSRIIWGNIIIIFIVALLSFIIAFFIARSILSSVNKLRDTMSKITSTGNLTAAELDGEHEIAEMARHFNILIKMLQNQFWTRDGLNELNEELSGELSYDELLNHSINFISRYIDACIGALYIYDEKQKVCELKSSFAFVERKYLSSSFKMGEGIIGQAAVEKKPILLKHIKREEAVANTGTISEPPKNIYAVPLIYEEKLNGVLELASFEDMSSVKIEFLNSAARIISTAIYTTSQQDQIKQLFDAAKEANEALQSRTDELSGANERLTAMNDELKAQSDELQAQAEELRAQKHELEAQRIQVEEADRLKSEFLSNMSHELRTPLNSVLALSQLMISRGTGKDAKQESEYLRIIERNGRHLLNLINDILDLSKIEAGRMDLYLTDFSPQQIIDDSLETIRPTSDKKDLKIKSNIEKGLEMHSDEDKLNQIILNMISNAVKFTEHGEIKINVHKSGSIVSFVVQDTGIGIPESEINHIFDEFRQVDGSTTRAYEGTGLGLAICQKLARLLGGEILVESEVGKGSTFSLNIPQNIGENGGKIPVKAASHKPSPVKLLETKYIETPKVKRLPKTVLVVDDDEKVRFLLNEYLTEAGYDVLTARGGREGLSMAQEFKPFAITLDIMMPDMDGWEVIRELKSSEDTADIPVLIISVSDDRATGMALGASGYVVKPIDRNILLTEINKLASVRNVDRILAVDDDSVVRMQLEDLLGGKGYLIETASGGREGIAKAISDPPDVIILDLMMPEMDGFTVLEQLKNEPATCDIPVIILTAKDLDKEERIRIQKAVHRIVGKSSMDNEELLKKLLNSLDEIQASSITEKSTPLILVVEDNDVAAIQIRSALEEKGYDVYTAFGGSEAIDFVQRNIPDAIILDLMMPGVDGFQVLENIRSTPKTAELPVLVLTAKELTAQDRARLSHNNIQQLIQKGSVDRDQLLKCVSNLLKYQECPENGEEVKADEPIEPPALKSSENPLLIVEDNPDNLLTITAILDEFNYSYITADDGRKAVDKTKEFHPSLILMDVQLPVMNGLDAAREIKSDPDTASIPVIAVTAKAMRGDREKILAAGCDDYLSKPIDTDELIKIIRKWS